MPQGDASVKICFDRKHWCGARVHFMQDRSSVDCVVDSSSFTDCIMKLVKKAKTVASLVPDLKVSIETALDRWVFGVSSSKSKVFSAGMATEAMRGQILM